MNFRSFICRAGALLVLISMLGAAQVAAAAAGKVLFVAGSVTLERKGTRALKAGDPLDLGDVVVTGQQSRAQILMADGARIALRAGSRFRIDELALPSNVQQPGMAVAVAAAGKSVGTLLKGGFSTRDGVIGKSNPSGYEMRTPIGTLGIRGTYYTAVFCRGDCADAPGLPAGQPIADGLYLVVDEGTITFNGRGLSLTLSAPTIEFIPVETSDPQQLVDPPAFLRNDGAGRLEAAGRTLRLAAVNGPLAQINDRRSPADVQSLANGPDQRVRTASSASDASGAVSASPAGDIPPEQPIVATTPLGRTVDLVNPQAPLQSQTSVAAAVPAAGQVSFTVATTQPAAAPAFNAAGSLLRFDAPFGTGATAPVATYDSGTAALVDAGSNGASGLRWGRWSGGSAAVTTVTGNQTLNLSTSSLHWIIGPAFELVPVLPVSGATNFVLAGGTSPTDTSGNAGVLNGATLSADFTAQRVSTTLSLDLNGLNWFATGTGPITAGTVRFGGTFTTVLVDGRVPGSGDFSGFFSAGPNTPDQLNGVGLSYQLNDSLQQLGTVSGVAAFVPGAGQPLAPPAVVRDVSYAVGNIGQGAQADGSASDSPSGLSLDASGNLIAFVAPTPLRASGTFSIGSASGANTGFDAATGIRWGRWQAGTANLIVSPNPAAPVDLTGEALHWIVDTGYGAAPAIPQTGTASYVLVGNTDPTDTLGNAGTLGAASLSADFTNRTLASAVSLTMAGHSVYADGSGTFAASSPLFSGTYSNVSIDNLVPGSGTFSGFFTVPRIGAGTVAGAGLTYNIVGNPSDLGVYSGALAFAQGNGTPLTPPPLQLRDIASIVPYQGYGGALVVATSDKFYAVDSSFSLTQLLAVDNAQLPQPTTYAVGTSTIQESNVDPVIMVRWGRWSGGNTTLVSLATGSTSTLDLTQRSLHWVESADQITPPVMPTSGTMTYTLAGATTPTDRAGNLGTLNSATFAADFTAQTVASTLDISINGLNWVTSGQGTIGAQAGLPAHQFSGVYNGGLISPIQGFPTGTFSGFFTNPTGAPGAPTGVGLTYTLVDDSGLLNVDGAAVFKKP